MWTELFLTGVVLGVLVLVFMLWHFGQGRELPDGTAEEPDQQGMKEYLVWRSFYVNPNDPRGWVPKTWGFGQTVNFRERDNARVFAFMIGVTLVSAIGFVLTVL